MKIYTKTGDSGTTSLFGGERVDKNSLRIEAYGEIDELNSLIGVILAEPEEVGPLTGRLLSVQSELFVLGSNLATPKNVKIKIPKITKSYVRRLEKEIDNWEKELTPLRNFILPGGSKTGAKLHLARAVSRRAERLMVSFSRTEKIDENLLMYINRLSDWLFTLARYLNALDGKREVIWKGRLKIKSRKKR